MVIGFLFPVLRTDDFLATTKMLDTTKGEQGSKGPSLWQNFVAKSIPSVFRNE